MAAGFVSHPLTRQCDPKEWWSTYLLEAAVHDTDLVSGELGLFAEIFEGDSGVLVDPGGADLEEALLNG